MLLSANSSGASPWQITAPRAGIPAPVGTDESTRFHDRFQSNQHRDGLVMISSLRKVPPVRDLVRAPVQLSDVNSRAHHHRAFRLCVGAGYSFQRLRYA